MNRHSPPTARLDIVPPQGGGALILRLSGAWELGASAPPAPDTVLKAVQDAGTGSVVFDAQGVTAWDSRMPAYVAALSRRLRSLGLTVEGVRAPEGASSLLRMATTGPFRNAPRPSKDATNPLEFLGKRTAGAWDRALDTVSFVGEASLAMGRLATGRARFQMRDVWRLIRRCGADALPIVSLISLLVGLILAFVGAVQLKMFGAQIYVASLVGIAVVRVMGAIMAGIIMAGRTGAAFAAQLGSMQVNEEIDALRTLDLDPMDFLVLPRILALGLMMPLLCLYADFMGVLGGLFVSVTMLDLNVQEYINMTKVTVGLDDLWIGLFHSLVFGILVAVSGCLKGMRCGRSAEAVGEAVTSAVVTGIVWIIMATAVITVACDALGI